ncbi:cysteine dioxygenase type 1-like [Daphnia carinata]|uniref:cysteine dioxygenase type 1-like n=1 Tax=Daphnia carinata TaxID=120202 RepID=UPI002580B2AA|nr:cysteine dioxygenase type 1-like [Daphnia carinata]
MDKRVGTLDELKAQLHRAFENDRVDVDFVKDLMESYKSNEAEWKKYAIFDRYKYTRNLVDEGNGKFNLMLLCWGESHASPIHDHADAHCFMKMLKGTLKEVRFDWPKECDCEATDAACEQLKEKSSALLKLDEVCYINDSMGLHRMENPSHVEGAVSLHLYSPPYDTCHMFDQRTGKKSEAKVTFWSRYGEKVSTITTPESCSPAASSCCSGNKN